MCYNGDYSAFNIGSLVLKLLKQLSFNLFKANIVVAGTINITVNIMHKDQYMNQAYPTTIYENLSSSKIISSY